MKIGQLLCKILKVFTVDGHRDDKTHVLRRSMCVYLCVMHSLILRGHWDGSQFTSLSNHNAPVKTFPILPLTFSNKCHTADHRQLIPHSECPTVTHPLHSNPAVLSTAAPGNLLRQLTVSSTLSRSRTVPPTPHLKVVRDHLHALDL
jgi:hypothetical protein